MKIVIRILILALLAILVGGAFIYFGIYNVAATQQHSSPAFHLMHYAMRQSVKARAHDLKVPDLSGSQLIQNGALLYGKHCLQCHGAPGVAPEEVGMGTRPAPANLVEAGREWPAEEIYWVIKHGIKMTAMPAWEYRLNEQQLWDLTAFIKRGLPNLSPAEYKKNYYLAAAKDVASTSSDVHDAVEDAYAGNPQAGRHAIEQYLCTTCHKIPGVVGLNGSVGPPLGGMAKRKYIGGVLLNNPDNMRAWLRDPQKFSPETAMPDLNIKEKDIRDITAYLYTLD